MASRPPRLRTVFVEISLLILLLPLGGVVLLRLYESALIRRTETELIAQSAVVAAAFAAELRAVRGELPRVATPAPPSGYGLEPTLADLDLTVDPILPEPAPARPTAEVASAEAVVAGARLTEVLTESRAVTFAATRVTDERGIVVASSAGDLGLSLAHLDEVRSALSGDRVELLRERHSDEPPPPLDSLSRTTRLRVFAAAPVRDGDIIKGAVLVSRTPMSVVQSLYGIRWHLLAGATVLFGTVLLVSVFMSRTVTRPLQELALRARRVAAGERDTEVAIARPGTLEVAELATAVQRMARTLAQRADYIHSFAASVSHEFKTPLAAIRGTIELLHDHLGEMSEAERARFLGNLDLDARRLELLVQRLLELARADVARPGDETTDVAALFSVLSRRPGFDVSLSAAPGLPRLRLSADSLEAILGNLIDNARRHAGDTARVAVTAEARVVEGRSGVSIAVLDDGKGISEANLKRVFDPFFTTARDQGGTGLGLAIVRTLVLAHAGDIGLHSRPGETVVRVWLPAA